MYDIMMCNYAVFQCIFYMPAFNAVFTVLFSVLNEDGEVFITFRSKSLVVPHNLLLVFCKNKLADDCY